MRILILAMMLTVAACSSADPAPPDRLLVLDEGSILTMSADGGDVTTIATTDEGVFFQPIWSQDRSHIAYSFLSEQSAINVARVEDGAVFSAPTDSFPFYFSFSSQLELGILSSGSNGLRLDTTQVTADGLGDIELTETGQPLYYSWSPDGARLAAHIGTDRLLTSDLDESSDIGLSPGGFAAPAWTNQGILAVTAGANTQSLVLTDASGESRTIATVSGPSSFVPNGDASLIAVQSLRTNQQFQNAAFQQVPRVPAGRLSVVDTATGEVTTVIPETALAFFWSPQGDKLLILDLVPGPLARWQVWSEDGIQPMAEFVPDQAFFAEFVTFFDQYAQSVSLWSPDGTTIAFPGMIDGRSGIWSQTVGGEPEFVHSGRWVTWAP